MRHQRRCCRRVLRRLPCFRRQRRTPNSLVERAPPLRFPLTPAPAARTVRVPDGKKAAWRRRGSSARWNGTFSQGTLQGRHILYGGVEGGSLPRRWPSRTSIGAECSVGANQSPATCPERSRQIVPVVLGRAARCPRCRYSWHEGARTQSRTPGDSAGIECSCPS